MFDGVLYDLWPSLQSKTYGRNGYVNAYVTVIITIHIYYKTRTLVHQNMK